MAKINNLAIPGWGGGGSGPPVPQLWIRPCAANLEITAHSAYDMFSKNIYSTKKLRKMCLRACNTRTVIFHEMCTSYAYEVSFYLSNECLFETIALIEAWKLNVEVDLSCPPFSQNIVLFVYQLSLELFHTITTSP